MVVIAEGFLQHIEEKAINTALIVHPQLHLKSFNRFVDDVHARFPSVEKAETFKGLLNEQHPKITYTMEQEDEGKVLNFLDVTIKNNKLGKYEFRVH